MGLIIMEDREYDKLRELFEEPGNIVIRKSVADKFDVQQMENVEAFYNYGGDADVWIDFVGDVDHYFLTELVEADNDYSE